MRGELRQAARCGIAACVLAGLCALCAPGAQAAGYPDSVGVAKAKAKVRSAARELERAEARLGTARAVKDATVKFSDLYGPSVGRWLWLANEVGWPRASWGWLCSIIYRESRGEPKAANPASSARGLMQLMGQWWNGEWPIDGQGRHFDPTDPRLNLYWSHRIYEENGAAPWAL